MHCSTWSHYHWVSLTSSTKRESDRLKTVCKLAYLMISQYFFSSAFKPFQHNKTQKGTYLDTATPETYKTKIVLIDSTSRNTTSKVWKPHHLFVKSFVIVFRAGGGLVHVGIMLWSAEWSDGYRGRERAAARFRGRCGAVSFRSHCGILHIPTYQLHQHQPGVSVL